MSANEKIFKININQVWSETVKVKARNVNEAKRRAWDKWKPKKSNYKLNKDQ